MDIYGDQILETTAHVVSKWQGRYFLYCKKTDERIAEVVDSRHFNYDSFEDWIEKMRARDMKHVESLDVQIKNLQERKRHLLGRW